MRQAGEPAVEDILESIKKVIVRDAQGPVALERIAPVAVPDDDGESPEDEEILDLAHEFAPVEEAPLMKSATVGSMRDSLAALESLTAPNAPAPAAALPGETSLESLVREMLRPALAEWLDKNLPPLVERMVSAEIARIVGKKG